MRSTFLYIKAHILKKLRFDNIFFFFNFSAPMAHGLAKCPIITYLRISEHVVDDPGSCLMPTAYVDILLLFAY